MKRDNASVVKTVALYVRSNSLGIENVLQSTAYTSREYCTVLLTEVIV